MGVKELIHSVASVGVLLHSISIVAIFTPLYLIARVIELKNIEEPALEMRFGESYADYKRAVPMFVPRRPEMTTGGRLIGTASAIARNELFGLPYYLELSPRN
ncbi:MAG: hypothetical protein P8181_00295 [bacterium]